MAVGDAMYGPDVVKWWADLQPNFMFSLLPAHPWVRHNLPYVLWFFSSVSSRSVKVDICVFPIFSPPSLPTAARTHPN